MKSYVGSFFCYANENIDKTRKKAGIIFVRTKFLWPVSGAIMSSQFCLEAQSCTYFWPRFEFQDRTNSEEPLY